jgi:hypothetical protein
MPSFRQLYQETVSDLQTELKGALVDLGHMSAFDFLLKETDNLLSIAEDLVGVYLE